MNAGHSQLVIETYYVLQSGILALCLGFLGLSLGSAMAYWNGPRHPDLLTGTAIGGLGFLLFGLVLWLGT